MLFCHQFCPKHCVTRCLKSTLTAKNRQVLWTATFITGVGEIDSNTHNLCQSQLVYLGLFS